MLNHTCLRILKPIPILLVCQSSAMKHNEDAGILISLTPRYIIPILSVCHSGPMKHNEDAGILFIPYPRYRYRYYRYRVMLRVARIGLYLTLCHNMHNKDAGIHQLFVLSVRYRRGGWLSPWLLASAQATP